MFLGACRRANHSGRETGRHPPQDKLSDQAENVDILRLYVINLKPRADKLAEKLKGSNRKINIPVIHNET